jgi:hypothetical protein
MPRLSKIGAAALAAFGWTGLSSVTADFLVIAGGGGGGELNQGGGGGAGGYRSGTTSLNPTQSYTVTVGGGGSSSANGSDSIFNTVTSTGGGRGASTASAANTGGSGGGGNYNPAEFSTGAAGNTPSTSPSQGNNGGNGAFSVGVYYYGGGGGGASAVGTNASAGGAGVGGAGTASSISGSSVTRAGGGGGGSATSFAGGGGAGGAGGGGAGGKGTNGLPATANTGSGGGGASDNGSSAGGNGGSGVVIISYPSPQKFGGGIVTTSGANTIHTFQTSGTLSPLSSLTASYLIVAGGGAGGGLYGGGGGAGGLLSGSGVTIDTNSIYLVTVGAGGTGTTAAGNNGTNSAFSMVTTAAVGGGGGGSAAPVGPFSGGSGGGANGQSGAVINGAAGTSGQGNAGGSNYSIGPSYGSGGGGGAGAVGANGSSTNSGNGGVGISSSISGTATFYAGGGGGGNSAGGTVVGSGGNGGGGSGGAGATGNAGTNNLGGGGGGATSGTGGAGGSGIVIISYAGSTQLMAGGTVTISGGNVIHTFTSSGYLSPIKLVGNSLRFRSSASAYLNRTPSTAGNSKTFTINFWVKRGIVSTTANFQRLLLVGSSTANYFSLLFDGSGSGGENELSFYVQTSNAQAAYIATTAKFRDPASWYMITLAVDTTQATSTNRVKLYINGVQQTALSAANYPSQNTDIYYNSAVPHYISENPSFSSSYFDGYITEFNSIDGQQLTPNSFGTFNSFGVWQPITYGGSYGTNGFYLPFTNTTSTTTLGFDFSPNGNNWTTNNISLTAGSTYDSMTDVPTLTSTTAANYCVLNPLNPNSGTISNGNLNQLFASASYQTAIGTLAMSSGSWYCEVTCTAIGGTGDGVIGIAATQPSSTFVGNTATSYGWYSKGSKYNNGTAVSYNGGATWTTNDVIGIAFNATSGSLEFYKNGTSQGVAYSGISAGDYFIGVSSYSSTTYAVNFGQQPFAYTAPSGFLPLNTFNL